MTLRKILFWSHLAVGVTAGLVFLWMAGTGILLALQPQVTAWAGRASFAVAPPSEGTPRLALADLLDRVRAGGENASPTSVVVKADPTAAIALLYGRERALYADPYTGVVLGRGPERVAAFYRTVEHLHRWFALPEAVRPVGKGITGAAACALLLLLLSGIYLWWPRRASWKNAVAYRRNPPGKARDWNWHTVTGFWLSPLLLLTAVTGVVMAYPWANDLIYTLTRSAAPERGGRPGREGDRPKSSSDLATENLDLYLAAAQSQAPDWRAITLNVPRIEAPRVTVMVEEGGLLHPHPRATLILDAQTGVVTRWEPYASQNLGRRVRGWIKPLHTGEAFGLVTALTAVLNALGLVLLVWTGFSLSWRRFFGRARPSS